MTRVKTNHTQGCQYERTHQWRPDARQLSAAGPAHQAAAFCERAPTVCRLMRTMFVALWSADHGGRSLPSCHRTVRTLTFPFSARPVLFTSISLKNVGH